MDYLIKLIRKKANISQQELADKLGTTVVTVSRWENGKAEPNKMARERLLEYVLSLDLSLSDKILEHLAEEHAAESPVPGRNVVNVYHGSKSGISGEIVPKSRINCDFGSGFYMGTDPMQPLILVCNDTEPHFYSIRLDLTGLKVLDVEQGVEWALLVAFNRGYMDDRKGTAIYEKFLHMADGYDIIKGYIADDRLYQVLTRFMDCEITDEALAACLHALDLGIQYVAVSEKACRQISILNDRVLSDLELRILKKERERQREDAIRRTDEITKAYRRTGKYFDEILEEMEDD